MKRSCNNYGDLSMSEKGKEPAGFVIILQYLASFYSSDLFV